MDGFPRTNMKPIGEMVVALPKDVAFATRIIGFGKLAGYRLYRLDGVNKVASAEWIEAEDDNAAFEVARERCDGSDCEVWQGTRLVARIVAREI